MTKSDTSPDYLTFGEDAKLRADGTLDVDHYVALGRQMRADHTRDMVQGLFRRISSIRLGGQRLSRRLHIFGH
ncbi:RSP_7527 family protein [Roseovarius sp. C7]|uniref:RSP_7527 family protein n=1 Tax=Roseovarius sp. C7 TaxID=3398643 RepID=UPI0039F65F0A